MGRCRRLGRRFFFAALIACAASAASSLAPFAARCDAQTTGNKPAVVAPVAAPYAGPSAGDAAARMNLEFRAAYARARAQVLATSKPIIWFDGEKLVLIVDGKQTAGSPLPEKYHRLKAIAHLPFTVYLCMRVSTMPPADDEAVKWRRLSGSVDAVEQELPKYEFTADVVDRQRKIIDESKRIITAAAAGKPPTTDELLAFTRRMGPLQEANALEAAAIELDHYRKQVEAWSKERGESFLKEVSVVVSGSQMPRKRNRVVQLFAAILGVPGEGTRIVYAEGLYDEQKALNLFGTHHLDAASAAAFFDDPARLDEDLLSRGAEKYVRETFNSAASPR